MGCDDDAEGRNEKDSCGSELKKFTEGTQVDSGSHSVP